MRPRAKELQEDGFTSDAPPEHQLVERVAERFYHFRGDKPGHALDDWLAAERAVEELSAWLRQHDARPPGRRQAQAVALMIGVAILAGFIVRGEVMARGRMSASAVTYPSAQQMALTAGYRALYTQPRLLSLR